MIFIKGRQVPMKQAQQEVTSKEIRTTLEMKIDWSYENGVWCTVTEICESIGIPPTHKNRIQVGAIIREIMPNVLTRRSNSRKLILIPCRINDEISQ